MPPKQKKITDSFKTLSSQSTPSSQDDSSQKSPNNVENISPSSNPYGLSLTIEPIDDNNKLDTFIQSAIQGGVKRNWNLHQLKQTLKELQEEFKPKIEERVQFWETELAKVDEILRGSSQRSSTPQSMVETPKSPFTKSTANLPPTKGDLAMTKSQKSLLDYFSSNHDNNEQLATTSTTDTTALPTTTLDEISTAFTSKEISPSEIPTMPSDSATTTLKSEPKANLTTSPNMMMTNVTTLSCTKTPSKSKAIPSPQPTSVLKGEDITSQNRIKTPTPLLSSETQPPQALAGTTSTDQIFSSTVTQPSAATKVLPSSSSSTQETAHFLPPLPPTSTQDLKVAQKAPKSQSKKSTRKTSKKASKKKKKILDDEDDAMIDDEDDEYKPSLTDEEDQLILDEEEDMEDDEDEELMLIKDQQLGKRKRGSSNVGGGTELPPPRALHEDVDDDETTHAKKESGRAEEASEEETSIKTRSARKKTRGVTPKLGNASPSVVADIHHAPPPQPSEDPFTSIKTEDMIDRDDSVSRSSNQSPLPFDDVSSISMSDHVQSSSSMLPQTPSTKKKKRTAASSTRRRKKKPSGSDDTSGQALVSSTAQGDYDGDVFLGLEDEHYVASKTPSSQIDRTLPQHQFWEYINSFFPVIKKDRLKLLEGENSENDEAFKIGKKGKYYTEKWEEETTKIYPNLPKKTTSDTTQQIQLADSDAENLNVEKASKLFFSQHSLSQRLLSSLIEERDLVPLDTFVDDLSASSSSNSYNIDSDNESIDEQTPRKSSRSTRKAIATPSSAKSTTFPSSSTTTPMTPSTANIFSSNSVLPADFTNQSSVLEHQQQFEISEYLKQKLPNLSKNQIQSANQILSLSNQFKDVEQMFNSTSFDYAPQYISVFEEKLLHEIKSIGILPQQQQLNPQLWVDEESREDDDICAEIRTLQNKLREQMQRTNDIRMKILKRVKSQLHEEKDIEKKISQFAELERKLFPPTPQNKARR